MNEQQHLMVLDQLGDVVAAVDEIASDLDLRVHRVHDYSRFGVMLEELPDLGVAIVAVDALDSPTVQRLAVVNEELPALQTIVVVPDGMGTFQCADSAAVNGPLHCILRSGVRDVVAHPVDTTVLADSVKHALSNAAALRAWARRSADGIAPANGRVHGVTSGRGGAGRTFLAINMAAVLATDPDATVCVLDLDPPIGSVADAVGLRPRFTVADLLEAPKDDVSTVFTDYCEQHPMGFAVLAAPPPERSCTITVEDALRVVHAARRHFTHVVVDLPPAASPLALGVLREATDKWCVLKADLLSIRAHASIVPRFERFGINPDEVRAVLNKVQESGGIAAEDVDRALPQGLSVALPFTRRAAQATNSAKTMLEVEPHGTLTRRLESLLAPYIASGNADTRVPGRGEGWRWLRLRRRS